MKKENPIEKIFWGRLELEKASSYIRFEKESKIQRLLHALKYRGIKDVGTTLGKLAAKEFVKSDFFNEIDVIVPIPIHKKKQRKRGYNQSHFIADGISAVTQIPVDKTSIRKNLNTSSQTNKSRFERYKNVNQTFTLTERASQLTSKHILLVDDVVTTGATIEACGNELKKIDGSKISLLTIACTY